MKSYGHQIKRESDFGFYGGSEISKVKRSGIDRRSAQGAFLLLVVVIVYLFARIVFLDNEW